MCENINKTHKELIVITTITNWDEPPRFRHEVARMLAKKYKVLFVQIYSQRGKKRRRQAINTNLFIEKAGLSFPGIQRMFYLFPFLKKIYDSYLARVIEKKIKHQGYRTATLFNFQFDFSALCNSDLISKSIYFCNDDFVGQGNSAQKEIRNSWEHHLVSLSDLIITSSVPLKEKFVGFHDKIEVLFSGHSLSCNRLYKPERDSEDEKIKACFLGFLNGGVATEWFEHLLSCKGFKLTVIGPNARPFLPKSVWDSEDFKHIEYLEGDELQNELAGHDVLLMNYSSSVDNLFTSVPAKLFQYLSVGKPVVSSSMPNLIKLPEHFVYQAENKDDFIEKIRLAAVNDSEELSARRLSFASDNTWDHRAAQLFKMLQE